MLDTIPDKKLVPDEKLLPDCIFYSIRQASFLLGIAPSTIYDLHHSGQLTIRKIGLHGKKSVILKSDIAEYVEKAAMPRGANPKNGIGCRLPKPAAPVAAE